MLGRTGEVSLFGPVTSLYLFVPVVYGLVFLGEDITVRACAPEACDSTCSHVPTHGDVWPFVPRASVRRCSRQ
jgi:hypothetical protein